MASPSSTSPRTPTGTPPQSPRIPKTTATATEVDTESRGIDAADLGEAPRVKTRSARALSSGKEGNGGKSALKRSNGQKSLDLSGLASQTGKAPAPAERGKNTAEQASESPNASPRKLRRNVTNERDRGSPRITPRSTTEARTSVKKRPVSEKRTASSRNQSDSIKRSGDAPPRPSSKPPELLPRPGAWYGAPTAMPTSPTVAPGMRMPTSTAESAAFALVNTTASPGANLRTPEKDKTPSSPNRLRVNSSPANLSPSRKPQSPGHVTTSVSTTPVSTPPRSSATSPRSQAQSPSSPRSPGSPSRRGELHSHRRTTSLDQDYQLPRAQAKIDYPAHAKAWIGKTRFDLLSQEGKQIISAMAAVKQLYLEAPGVLGDAWSWTVNDPPPMRSGAQHGSLEAPRPGEKSAHKLDSNFLVSYKSFELAFRSGTIAEYLHKGLHRPTAALTPLHLAKQADNVFCKSMDLIRDALRPTDMSEEEIADAWYAVTDLRRTRWRDAKIKSYYREEDFLLVKAFAAATIDIMNHVVARTKASADEMSVEKMLRGFYFLGVGLFGFSHSDLQKLLHRVKFKEKELPAINKMLRTRIEDAGSKKKIYKDLDEEEKAVRDKVSTDTFADLHRDINSRSTNLFAGLSSKAPQFGPDILD